MKTKLYYLCNLVEVSRVCHASVTVIGLHWKAANPYKPSHGIIVTLPLVT